MKHVDPKFLKNSEKKFPLREELRPRKVVAPDGQVIEVTANLRVKRSRARVVERSRSHVGGTSSGRIRDGGSRQGTRLG